MLLSRCASNVLIPTGDVPITDVFTPVNVPNFKEFGYAVTGFAGETQDLDGNGPYVRFQTGGGNFGTNGGLVNMPVPGAVGVDDSVAWGRAQEAPVATQPVLGPKPAYNDQVACYTNPIPDLNGPAAAVGPPTPAAVP